MKINYLFMVKKCYRLKGDSMRAKNAAGNPSLPHFKKS
jgi:hypothetical protein